LGTYVDIGNSESGAGRSSVSGPFRIPVSKALAEIDGGGDMAAGKTASGRIRGAARTRPDKPSEAAKRAIFINVLRNTANVSRAALEAGMASTTAYRQRANHPGFARAWDAAITAALDDLEEALLHRALHGVERPVLHGGKRVDTVTTYSDALGMFILKTRRPEIYARSASRGEDRPADNGEAALFEIEAMLDKAATRSRGGIAAADMIIDNIPAA